MLFEIDTQLKSMLRGQSFDPRWHCIPIQNGIVVECAGSYTRCPGNDETRISKSGFIRVGFRRSSKILSEMGCTLGIKNIENMI